MTTTPRLKKAPPKVDRTTAKEDAIIQQALAILSARLCDGPAMTECDTVRHYLSMRLGRAEREHFGMLMLTNTHHLIEDRELFVGTVDGAPVYPREVVKAVLEVNAAAVIFYHNHPSGESYPSVADRRITQELIKALGTVQVRVLDHLIVGGPRSYSLAEHGLL